VLKIKTPMGLTWIVVEDSSERLMVCPVNSTGAPITKKLREVTGPSAELLTGLVMSAGMDGHRELVHES